VNISILLLNAGRGSGEVAREHARHLVAAGHRVHFAHPRIGAGVDGAVNHDVPLHTAVLPVHENLPQAGEDQRAVSTMSHADTRPYVSDYERALEAIVDDVDVFVGHHANLTAIATQRVAQRHGKPFVLFLHGTGIEPRHQGGYDDRVWGEIEAAIRAADGVLVTTEYVRDRLVRPLVDLAPERFLVLPCGVDLERYRPDAAGDVAAAYDLPDPYVISPGALIHVKGPQNVVAASEVYGDLARTIFIGDGELRGELERELGERGRFLGFVPAEDKVRLIAGATVLAAAPEKKEHFGIIYVEALACGTIPVAYGGGGVGSVVTPDVGLLTERDPARLGAAVREILEDDERRRAMALAGRERAEAHYSYPRLVARLVEWLEELRVRS
jgi:glycosyltransferase involved in cell wall biosynthesis